MVHSAVLFVDDDEFVLHSLRRALVQEEYPKLYAKSAYEAMQTIKENDVHVVVTDMKMPVTDGLTFLTELKEKHPDIVRMVLSGYAQVGQIIQSINRGEIYRYISKPWDDGEDLKRIIAEGLQFYQHKAERRKKLKELEKLKSEISTFKVKTSQLSGELPSCRLCHKVLHEEHDDWETLPHLLTEVLNIRFAETICPDCATNLRRSR